MNKLFQQLLQQAKSRALPELERSAKGFIEDVAAPVVRSVGSIPDQLARPTKKWLQQALSPATFDRYGSANKLMSQQVGRRAPSVWGGQSYDVRLAQRLDPAQRFLQEYGMGNIPEAAASIRQVQGGIKEGIQEGIQTGMDTSRGILRKLQGIGPTALNPLATRTPTTLLGKTGQFFNPLSRANFAGYLADPVINTFVPESMRDTARVAAYTPGGLPVKMLSAGLYDTFLNPRNAGVGLATGTLRDNDPMRYGGLRALESINTQNAQRPIGTLSQLGGNEVEWRGPELEWQRTYSEGANPPPPAPGSLQDLSSGRQAGQVGSSVISNGAGVPAQRSDVINRALSQEVLNAAQQFNAPANVPLPSFYEGQQQLGRSMMQNGTLVSQLQELGGAPGMTPENLKSWAEKNPALAYRELLKRRGVQ